MLSTTPASSAKPVNPVTMAGALRSVPSAPHILSRLAALEHADNLTLGEIGRLVRLDAGLAIKVLRAAYGSADKPVGPHFTIEDAINRIGLSALQEVVRSTLKAQVFDFSVGVYGMDTEEFWRASISCAVAAEILAEKTGENPDFAYLAGLLHNVGMLAVDAWARAEESCLVFARREFPREFSAGEGAVLGFTHADVGATLLSAWNFPQALREPIRSQYVPTRYGAMSRMTCLLHVAKWLSAAVCTDEVMPKLPEDRFLDVLRITSYELDRHVVDVRMRVGAVRNCVESLLAA